MNTTENNKKIAEFLGWETDEVEVIAPKSLEVIVPFETVKGFFTTSVFKHDELKFHNDWNWLLLVAEKIETVETKDGRTFTIDIHKDNVIINQYGKYNNEIIVTEGGTRIENLYKACIEFVEWWNKEQSNNTVIDSVDEWVKGGFVGIEKIFGGKK